MKDDFKEFVDNYKKIQRKLAEKQAKLERKRINQENY